MSTGKLTAPEIAQQLAALNAGLTLHWQLQGNSLQKTFHFDDFPAAFAFMTRAAFLAERMNHHPDWTNVWNRVDVRLSTHDAGGITGLDFQLAAGMESTLPLAPITGR